MLFSESEFVSLDNISHKIANCFKEPFCKPDENAPVHSAFTERVDIEGASISGVTIKDDPAEDTSAEANKASEGAPIEDATAENTPAEEDKPKRQLILVGHNVGVDINYLRALGYDVGNLSTLQEIADTAKMWQFITRDTNTRSLSQILYECSLTGWNVHNAGNDAVYTLQIMISMAFKHLSDKSATQAEAECRINE